MLKKVFFSFLALLLIALIVLLLGVRGAFYPHTDPIEGPDGGLIPGSIAKLEKVELGGMEQYILMRGVDTSLPVLLWLHGGPGAAQMPLAHALDGRLEKEFVVVHWDQRGAGKSNPRNFDESTMAFGQFMSDAQELITYLKQRFGKEKIFLLGHSWGSHLGLELAAKYPEDLYAYIGASQVVDNHRAYDLGYQWLKEKIDQENNEGDRQKLEALGPPPYTEHEDHVAFAMLIGDYGGNFDVSTARLARMAMRAPEYSLWDYSRWLDGANRGSGRMWEEVFARPFDYTREIPSLEVPAFFLSGIKDHNTPYPLVKVYFDTLQAPHKELILFERSAHTPFLGEPEKFSSTLIRIKREVLGNTPSQLAAGGFGAYLDERIPELMDYYDIPGAIVGLVRAGQPAWANAYGYANLSTGRKMTEDAFCRVESISKPVTAWGVMKLVQEERIALDRPVVHYLKSWSFPDSDLPTEKITVRQLLSHTSGLALGTIGVRYAPDGEVPGLKEALTKDALLFQEPGKGFSYSNTGFNILELLIEEVTGRDFAEYMETEVLLPLDMEHASFRWREDFDLPVPNGYDAAGQPIPPYIYPDKAAGGLFATMGDIATFVSAGMTDYTDKEQAVLSDRSIEQLYQPVVFNPGLYALAFDAYGLGHFIEWLPHGEKAVSHGGQGSGWMTHFHAVPETGDAIIIFTNSQRSWPFFAQLLNDWAKWRGFSSVGMAKIVTATKVLWVLALLIFLIAAWQLWGLGSGLHSGRRHFAPLSRNSWFRRLVQGAVGAVILSGLLWAVNQKYLFVAAVFPVTIGWLAWAALLLGLLLVAAALFPVEKEVATPQPEEVRPLSPQVY